MGFRPSARTITRHENKAWPGVVIMDLYPDRTTTINSHREFLIPAIGLRGLKHVRFKNLVRLILEANPGIEISYSEMQLLWDAIVHKVYYFACACEREAQAMEIWT